MPGKQFNQSLFKTSVYIYIIPADTVARTN